MQNLWNEAQAEACEDELDLRVYSSRLLGRDDSLVLHGGGNTSVKLTRTNRVGEDEDLLLVKGSGWDLAHIERAGFAPVRMAHLLKLARLETLSDTDMVNELRSQMTDAAAPTPSVEAILHALLPHRYVDHTHADAIVTLTNTPEGGALIRDIYGSDVVVIPYVMPGFDLARMVAERYPNQAHEGTLGMVLMNHGIFSFGETAKESYDRMIELVSRAEDFLKAKGAWDLAPPAKTSPPPAGTAMAELRRDVSRAAGRPLVLRADRSDRAMGFVHAPGVEDWSQRGPATPDHVIRTKRTPMLGRDVDAYTSAYSQYFKANSPRARTKVDMLDPAPRVVLDPELGVLSAGRTAKDAAVVHDIYGHTMDIIERAEKLGGWRALSAFDVFEVEYWELEQAKLRKGGEPPMFQGEVVLITGAASGIGRAAVDVFLERGAAVAGIDLNPAVENLLHRPDYLGIQGDLTRTNVIADALERIVTRFGGVDMLLLNAGIFDAGTPIERLSDAAWERTLKINLDANLRLLRETYPYLRLSPAKGRVAIIGSKNIPAPGPGAGAYSTSKAALNQLARVAALEWAGDGIRINSLHPDAVFDTGIWSDGVLAQRAAHYGQSVEEYKRSKTLLGVEVTSRTVAELAADLCGPHYRCTTAAQIPVDGGNDRVI
ncbi:MAG: bifunctional aldolase/short-chain dehydrogenase [Gammaproteobacteria bacterium]